MTSHAVTGAGGVAGPPATAAAALGSSARFTAAFAALAMVVAHLPVTRGHLVEAPYVGASFVVLEVVGVAIAWSLLRRDTARRYAAAAAVSLAAVAAYVASRSVGLPQISDDIGNWTDPLGLAAVSAECLLATACATALRPVLRRRSARSPRRWPAGTAGCRRTTPDAERRGPRGD